MITDRIQIAGLDSYFQRKPALNNIATGPYFQYARNSRDINLGTSGPVAGRTIRTRPLSKGKQLEISGLQLLIEGEDLRDFLQFALGNNQAAPLIEISVMKEMFAGLFADPFCHRVHNIAGYMDFTQGTLTNGRIMEIDGIPTIVSVGKEECTWVSKKYVMPDPITIDACAWELATSKLTPPDSFTYSISIECVDETGALSSISTPGTVNAGVRRAIESTVPGVTSFQITFKAKVNQDSFLTERSLPLMNFSNQSEGDKIGRPLLRAINILETVESAYKIYSMTELLQHCSDHSFFDLPGPKIKQMIATLNLNAVLVNSENQHVEIYPSGAGIGKEDIYNSLSKYEYIQLSVVSKQFNRFEAKLGGELILRI